MAEIRAKEEKGISNFLLLIEFKDGNILWFLFLEGGSETIKIFLLSILAANLILE